MNAEIKTNVIKRNGEEVAFDLEKIINAIKGANKDVDKLHRMNEYQMMAVADNVAKKIEESKKCYESDPKPSNLAHKAAMVQKYNEAKKKKKK